MIILVKGNLDTILIDTNLDTVTDDVQSYFKISSLSLRTWYINETLVSL